MGLKTDAGIIYDYVVTGLAQVDIARRYDTDQWNGVSGTLQYYGFYDGTKGGYRKRFARGYIGLKVTKQMIIDYLQQFEEGDEYYFEDFLQDHKEQYLRQQRRTEPAASTAAQQQRQREEQRRQEQLRIQQEQQRYREQLRLQQEQQRMLERQRQAQLEAERQRIETERRRQEQLRRLQEEERLQRIRREDEMRQNRRRRVYNARDAKDYREVWRLCGEYVRSGQMETDLWFDYGYALHQLKQYETAIDCYRHYLNGNPGETNQRISRYNICLALCELKRYEEALTGLEQLRNEGYRAEHLETKLTSLRRSVNLDRAKKKAIELHLNRDYAGVCQCLREWADAGEDLGSAWFAYGYACTRIGEIAQATDAYSKAISYDPEDTASLNNRSILWMRQGKPEKALEDLQRICDLGKSDRNIQERMAGIRQQMENQKMAVGDEQRETAELCAQKEKELRCQEEARRLAEEQQQAREMEEARQFAEKCRQEQLRLEELRRAQEEEDFLLLMM